MIGIIRLAGERDDPDVLGLVIGKNALGDGDESLGRLLRGGLA
jgi:hypothetical protein